MRSFALTAVLVAGGIAASAGSADAQVYYRTPVGGYRTVPQYTPQFVPQYAPQFVPQQSFYPPQPIAPAGYAGVDNQAANYIRSLYVNTLGREPDPQGMQTWLIRLDQLGGDVDRLTREFNASAALELNSNNPAYRYGRPRRFR